MVDTIHILPITVGGVPRTLTQLLAARYMIRAYPVNADTHYM